MAQITLNSTGVASNGALVLQSNGTTAAVTINSSQGVEFNAGSAALPAITTTGDTNTGIFFPAADTIAFSEGGVEAARIDSSGTFRVKGAGTAGSTDAFQVAGTAPASAMVLNSSGNLYLGAISSALANENILTGGQGGGIQLIRNASASPTSGQSLGSYAWKGADSANSNAAAEAMIEAVAAENFSGVAAGTNMLFYTKAIGTGPGSSPSERMRIDSSGNLGVGVTSPLSRIDARAASATIDNYQQIQAITTNSAAINLGGGIGLGGFYSGTAAVAIFGNVTGRKENATDGNFSGYLAFGTNNNSTGIVERARIDSSGNMGIGTTTPSSRLEIVGVNPKLTINANDIVNGRTATLSLISGTSADPTSLCQIMYGASNSTTAGTLVFVEGDGTTQRMRITPAGEVVINNTVAYNSARLAVAGDLEARGSMKSYQSTRGGLAIGASVDLFSIPAGSFGTGISMIAYVEQRDDNIGALSNYQFSITGWGGSGVTVNVASNQGYGAGSPLTVSTGTSGGSAFVTLTNASGRTSTSLTMVVIVLLSYPSITWGW